MQSCHFNIFGINHRWLRKMLIKKKKWTTAIVEMLVVSLVYIRSVQQFQKDIFFAGHKKFCNFKSTILSPPYLISVIADITTMRVFLIVFRDIFYFLMSFCKCFINEIFDLVEKSYLILDSFSCQCFSYLFQYFTVLRSNCYKTLIHFALLVSFYTPWKHQEISRKIWNDYWLKCKCCSTSLTLL